MAPITFKYSTAEEVAVIEKIKERSLLGGSMSLGTSFML